MKERVWSRLNLWMAALDVAAYAPTTGISDGTVQVPIRLLRRLRTATEAYEAAHNSYREMPYLMRARQGLKLLWPWS